MAIQRLVKLANKLNIKLRLKYRNLSKHFLYSQIRYINTKQTEKVEEYTTKFKACLGEIIKDFENSNPVFNTKTRLLFIIAKRIYFKKKYSKNKIYRFHAPEVECLAKWKIHKEYEFGNKVSIAATSNGVWLVGAQTFHGNTYNGHTLKKSLWQIYRVTRNLKNIFVDIGYRKHNFY